MAVRETNSISESSSCVRFFCFLSSCSFSWNSISVYHLDIFCFYYTIRIQLFIAGLSNYGIGAVAYQIIVLLYRTWALEPGLSLPYPSRRLTTPHTPRPAPRATTSVCKVVIAEVKNCIYPPFLRGFPRPWKKPPMQAAGYDLWTLCPEVLYT